jgi:hypothetical protein
MTPRELAAELWGPKAAADPKGDKQRLIRQIARDEWGNAPRGRWHFDDEQVAVIRATVATLRG